MIQLTKNFLAASESSVETPPRFQVQAFEFTPAIGISFSPRTSSFEGSMKRKLPYAAILAGLATLYVLGAKLGLSLAFKSPSAAPVWPPAGLALAAVLLLGYRVWPGILLGAFLSNATNPPLAGAANGSLLAASLGIAIGHTAEALVACWLVKGF